MQNDHRITKNFGQRLLRLKFMKESNATEDRENCTREMSESLSQNSWKALLADIRSLRDPMPVVELITAVLQKRGRRFQEFTNPSEG